MRRRALGTLAREKDGYAQQKLIEGLKNPDEALVTPEKALQFLSNDPHAEAYTAAREVIKKPPNEEAKAEALRLLAADPKSAPLFEKVLRDKDEQREHRQIAASALYSLNPGKFQKHARAMLLDKSEYEDIRATSLTALSQFGDQEAVAKDKPLLKGIQQLSTKAKSAQVQKLIEVQRLADRINTAAITYDPAFDLPKRLRVYGRDRNVRMDARNRMLRAAAGIDPLREHFKLGVNFIESLVNRHRVEAYVLDDDGRVAASFARLRWGEQDIVDRAAVLLREREETASPVDAKHPAKGPHKTLAFLGSVASVAVAFFPKCPICWAAYLSMFGIAGLHQIPYSPWLQPIFALVMTVNLASVWLRGRSSGQLAGPFLASLGAVAILVSRLGLGLEKVAIAGVVLTLIGSVWTIARSPRDEQSISSWRGRLRKLRAAISLQ